MINQRKHHLAELRDFALSLTHIHFHSNSHLFRQYFDDDDDDNFVACVVVVVFVVAVFVMSYLFYC